MTLAQKVLEALADGCATTAQLETCLEAKKRLRQPLNSLRQRGLIRTAGGVHELTGKGRVWLENGLTIRMGPRPDQDQSRSQTLRARVWRYLRIKRKVSLDEILMTLCDGTEKSAEANIRRYLRTLTDVGYLIRTRSGWILPSDRDTGPMSPILNTVAGLVIDRNTGAVWEI